MNFLTNISSEKQTDRELIRAFKESNDSKYLSILYQRYMDLVFGICFKYFKETERSKDAVMEIYVELNTKLKLHEVDNFKGWLHVLARNFCLMQLRSPKNLKTSEFSGDFMQSVENTHLTNEAFEKEEDFIKLEDCMKRLPGDQQQTIKLFFLQKKCYNEIAEITGHDWSKVRSFIQNGKRNLKICIEGKK